MNPDVTLTLMFCVFLVYFVVVPALTYFVHEERWRHAWRRQWLIDVPQHAPGGAFRDQDGDYATYRYRTEQRGAPRQVKQVVVVSLVLGHMFVPGLLMGMVGMVFGLGIGLVSIPGLILAARIYRNAFGLLRCEPAAAVEARFLRKFAIWLNAAVMIAVTLISMEFGLDGLWMFFAVYAGISVLHAQGLGDAADAIDAVHAAPVVVAASARSSRAPEVAV